MIHSDSPFTPRYFRLTVLFLETVSVNLLQSDLYLLHHLIYQNQISSALAGGVFQPPHPPRLVWEVGVFQPLRPLRLVAPAAT